MVSPVEAEIDWIEMALQWAALTVILLFLLALADKILTAPLDPKGVGMTDEQWITAAWMFGGVFTISGLMLLLSFARGRKKRPSSGPTQAWEFHEGSHEGKFWRKTKSD
jgi:hypothetical protein